MSGPNESVGVVMLKVALPQDAIAAIEEIAQRRHKTKTQVLREAIALKEFVDVRMQRGDRVLIEADGVMREVVFQLA